MSLYRCFDDLFLGGSTEKTLKCYILGTLAYGAAPTEQLQSFSKLLGQTALKPII